MLFKLIYTDKSNWDILISNAFHKKIKDFVNSLNKIKLIQILRYISVFPKNEVLSIELHGFVDSSLKAFAAVIYLCVVKNLQMKNSTVPRLELYEVMCFSIVFKYCVFFK